MNVALQALLARHEPHTLADYQNALKEVIQELALLGLWRAKFYEHAAFYGGTALRIFHGCHASPKTWTSPCWHPPRDSTSSPTLKRFAGSSRRSGSASAWNGAGNA